MVRISKKTIQHGPVPIKSSVGSFLWERSNSELQFRNTEAEGRVKGEGMGHGPPDEKNSLREMVSQRKRGEPERWRRCCSRR